MTQVTEIAPDLFRISTFVPEAVCTAVFRDVLGGRNHGA
jgi:hypothetical protein